MRSYHNCSVLLCSLPNFWLKMYGLETVFETFFVVAFLHAQHIPIKSLNRVGLKDDYGIEGCLLGQPRVLSCMHCLQQASFFYVGTWNLPWQSVLVNSYILFSSP